MSRAVSAALAAVLATTLSGAASAAPAPGDDGALRIEAPDVYYTQMSDPTRAAIPLAVDTGGVAVPSVVLTVDASDVRGKVRLHPKGSCAQGSGDVITCRLGPSRLRDGLVDLEVFGADKAAAPGTRGTLRLTAVASDGRRAEAETVMVAGTPELWDKKIAIKGAAAGRPVELWTGVLNRGPIAATGFGIVVSTDARLRLARAYRNCRYTATDPTRAYCYFDRRIEPGRAFAFTGPFRVSGGQSLTKALVYTQLFAPGQDAGPYFDERRFTVRGSGPPLALTPTSPKGFTGRSDVVSIETDQKVDVQAVGGDLRGKPGDVVRIDVGVRNTGPGSIESRYLRYEIIPPGGTTLIPPQKPSPDPDGELEYNPWVCQPWRAGEKRYTCWTKNLPPGAEAVQTLGFRIDETGSGDPGRVAVVLKKPYAQRDPDEDDNVALITVNGDAAEDGAGPLGLGLTTGLTAAGVLALAAATPYGIRRLRGRAGR
ncbi:hypothetical protein [Streptomyces cavernae]|uniref:hypothetical protein n=1 Tax=Streptomyces cavernae TaxID=2259034 RepID=UPI000FEB9A85|nr:hypothetical protein [Streptomyces cavernae]